MQRPRRAGPVRDSAGTALAGLVTLAVLIVAAPAPVRAQKGAGTAPTHTVVGRVEEHEVQGAEPIGSRRLHVLLPPDFDRGRRYPVVYAQDGQDLFDAATASGRDEWGVDELLAAGPPGIPPLIVVGIEAAPHALLDMAPPGSTDGARADVYARFIVDIVKPFVDRTYPTRPGRQNAVLLGRGAGALFSIYAAWTHAAVFGGAIAIELPELDATSMGWVQQEPADRPHVWIEQSAGDTAVRPSGTSMLEALRAGASVDYSMGGGAAPPLVLLAAGLRALFSP
jgi:enterochelin esterase-like enzyme